MRSIAFGHALDALSFVFGEPSDLQCSKPPGAPRSATPTPTSSSR